MADQPQSLPPLIFEDGNASPETFELTADTPCVGCEYNLRGLHSDGNCPECGTPIGRSLDGPFLRYADPAYLQRLAKGASLLVWGFAIATLTSIARIIVPFAWFRLFGPDGYEKFWWANISIALVGIIISFPGLWLAATPSPNKSDKTPGRMNLRKFTRIMAVLSLANSLLTHIWFLLSTTAGLGPFPHFIGIIAQVIHGAALLAVLAYFRRLALRIPSKRLAGRTRLAAWVFGILTAIGLTRTTLTILYLPATSASPTPPIWVVIAWGTTITMFGLAIFHTFWLIQLIQYRRAFRELTGVTAQDRPAEPPVNAMAPSPAD